MLLLLLTLMSAPAASQPANPRLPLAGDPGSAMPGVLWKADGPPTARTVIAAAPDAPQSEAEVTTVPFASDQNRIELDVVNTSARPAPALRVRVADPPSWLRLAASEQIMDLAANQSATYVFNFAVDASAPVDTRHTLRFEASIPDGQAWMKTLRIEVAAPETFRLLGNYPNPFNPQTTIAYVLPREARVSLRIYNMLGQEVALLSGERQPAGRHEAVWDAGQFASGVYFYRLSVEGDGAPTVAQGTLLLVR